jgi:hypothetical protein
MKQQASARCFLLSGLPFARLAFSHQYGIAWKKKKFCSKFIKEENYIEFTKLATRLLDAHTQQLAAVIQEELADWLCTVGENGAAAWFQRYWTGRNYTNALACYAGNNNAQDIESRWRYLKQEVCCTAGKNLRMTL